jgi:hypothetical protein
VSRINTEHKNRSNKLVKFTFLKNTFDKLKSLNPATAGTHLENINILEAVFIPRKTKGKDT